MPRARGTPLGDAEELRGARAPKQARSVEALQRISAAASALFAAREYEDVSVAEIAAAAGISVGAFYLRFRSKEHVVAFLLGEVRDALQEGLRREGDPARWQGRGIEAVITWYLSTMVEAFVQHRGVLRPASVIARQTRDRELLALLTDFNAEAHARFHRLLLDRATEIAHPRPELAVKMMSLWVSAAVREAVLYSEPVSSLAPKSRDELIRELTRAAVAYLTTA